jgi:hypothetical protein
MIVLCLAGFALLRPGFVAAQAAAEKYIPLEAEHQIASKGCMFFMTVKVAGLLKHVDIADLAKLVSAADDKPGWALDFFKPYEQSTGWTNADFDRLTFLGNSPNPRESMFISSSPKAFDRTLFLKTWGEGVWEMNQKDAKKLEPTTKTLGGQRYYERREEAMYFPYLGSAAKPPMEGKFVFVHAKPKVMEALLGAEVKEVVWENHATKLLRLARDKQAIGAAYAAPHYVALFRKQLRNDFALLTDRTHVGLLVSADTNGIRLVLQFSYEEVAIAEKAEKFARLLVEKSPVLVDAAIKSASFESFKEAGLKAKAMAEKVGESAKKTTIQRQGRQVEIILQIPYSLRDIIHTANACLAARESTK